jgi:hypothetical protein
MNEGTLPFTRVRGVIYHDADDIQRMPSQIYPKLFQFNILTNKFESKIIVTVQYTRKIKVIPETLYFVLLHFTIFKTPFSLSLIDFNSYLLSDCHHFFIPVIFGEFRLQQFHIHAYFRGGNTRINHGRAQFSMAEHFTDRFNWNAIH